MSIPFHPEVEAEPIEAINYYENCEPGLGLDFSREVHASTRNICYFPAVWPVIDGDVRRCLVHRFPYGVLYSIEPDGVFILAVMHLHREPGYRRHRRAMYSGS